MGNIDPTFFIDTDGTRYLIYKEDGNAIDKPTPIWIVSLNTNGTVITSNKTFMITNDLPWEVNHYATRLPCLT
jgi:hypothetical protein